MTDALTRVGITVRAAMTTPSRPGKAPRPVWEVTAPGAYHGLMYDLGGKRWRRAFSFWEDPTEAIVKGLETYRPESYGERVEGKNDRSIERAERLEGWSEKAGERAAAEFEKSRRIVDGIPFGQPILVGHHSEGRHRRDLERSQAAGFRGLEESKKAERLASRARGAEARVERQESVGFCQRRIEEAETAIRKLERSLAGPAHDSEEGRAWRARKEARLQENREKAAYWRKRQEELGGVGPGPGSVRVGQFVTRQRSGRSVYRVERVNKKTVSVVEVVGVCVGWKWKIPYAEILSVRDTPEPPTVQPSPAVPEPGPSEDSP